MRGQKIVLFPNPFYKLFLRLLSQSPSDIFLREELKFGLGKE